MSIGSYREIEMKKERKERNYPKLYGFILGISFAFGFQLPFLFWYLYSFYFLQ